MVMQRFFFFFLIIDKKFAHILAQFTKQIEDLIVLMEETPSLIEHACAKIPDKKNAKISILSKGQAPK